MKLAECSLCDTSPNDIVWQDGRCTVLRVQEPGFPGFLRVVWRAHRAEFTDLTTVEQIRCMQVVACVERVMREVLQPDKVNLASLGNVVPHLHWHVIARFVGDGMFPAPIWAPSQRPVDVALQSRLSHQMPQVERLLCEALNALPGSAGR